MKEKKDCKIVQDLLPNYIEGLTNEESNRYIEEHLSECTECINILENMKKDLELNTKKSDKKEIEYFKKFNNKIKILKLLLIIVAIIILSILGTKMFILGNLKNKLEEKLESNNYYLKYYSYSGGEVSIQETYVKDEKYLVKMLDNKANFEYIEFYDGEKSNGYITNNNEKIAAMDIETATLPLTRIPNYLYIDNIWGFIDMCIGSSIVTENCNGKQCYRIKSIDGTILYVDKETGLPVRTKLATLIESDSIKVDIINDYFYEFDCVTENDLAEPDITEYEIQ